MVGRIDFNSLGKMVYSIIKLSRRKGRIAFSLYGGKNKNAQSTKWGLVLDLSCPVAGDVPHEFNKMVFKQVRSIALPLTLSSSEDDIVR